MSCKDWDKKKAIEFIDFNPKECITKKSIAKKIAMDKIQPFTKFIHSYEISEFKGGTKFKNGDTLFARITPCLENGKTSQVNILEKDEVGFGSTEFIVLREKDNISDKDFIYYLAISPKFRDIAIKSMVGSSGRQRVQQNVIEETEFLLPSLPEQKAIASILSALDDKIELNNKINKNLEEMAQAIFKSWFVDFEPFQYGEFVESELGLIPKGWRVKNLGNLCDSISKKHKFDREKLIFLNTGDVANGLFINSNYMNISEMPGQAKKAIRKNDILYSEIRPINKHFAYVNFDADNYVVSTKLMVIRANNINPRRLYHYLTSQNVIKGLQLEAESRSGTFPQIRFENIQNIKIIIANEHIEREFALLLEKFYKIVESNMIENKKLAQLRDTLLPKLMNGEIRVPLEVE